MDYADTGFLGSLYAPDAHSLQAIGMMRRQTVPLAFTWIHQLEFGNALRLRVFRGEITAAQRDASLNVLLADVAGGVLSHTAPPLPDIMIEAERLSASHCDRLGTPSLDILHVAPCKNSYPGHPQGSWIARSDIVPRGTMDLLQAAEPPRQGRFSEASGEWKVNE